VGDALGLGVGRPPAEHASPPIAEQREIHSPPVEAVVRLLAPTA
jgi:hypothetical protein